MKKCLIIDDDPLICDLLKHFCSKQEWIGRTLTVGDGNQALHALDAEKFDLIFLDYNLPDLKGKDILNLMPSPIPTIMVTTEEAFGAASYDYDQIIDFLLKPLTYERFLKSIQRYRSSQQNDKIERVEAPKKMFLKDGNTTVILAVDTILYMKSEANYVVFYTADKKVMSLQTLKKLEEELPDNFIRVQKSYIINLNYLDALKSDIVVIAGTEIPIGAVHKEQLNERLEKWNK